MAVARYLVVMWTSSGYESFGHLVIGDRIQSLLFAWILGPTVSPRPVWETNGTTVVSVESVDETGSVANAV